MDYLIAVPGPSYPLADGSFATESAFAEHLLELRKAGGSRFDRLVVLAPAMDESTYEANKHGLKVLVAERDNVVFVPAPPEARSTVGFWRRCAPRLWKTSKRAIGDAALVHTDISYDIRTPMTAIVAAAARRSKRPVVFVVDVDFRGDAKRNRDAGMSGTKRYVFERFVLEPYRWVQVWLAVRKFQLVLLKSASLVSDFGGGRASVKNFYDTVHSPEQILGGKDEKRRLKRLRSATGPLELCYFGRLIDLKGCDRMIEAVRLAREQGCETRLTFIGDGPCGPELHEQVQSAGLEDAVKFIGQVPYGDELFDHLSSMDLTLATPLVQETPRAAFDSMARGIPLLAFDISYFRDLAAASDAVLLADWPSAESLAKQIVAIAADRDRLAGLAERGLEFARENTQQKWLERRMDWTIEFALGEDPQAAQESRVSGHGT